MLVYESYDSRKCKYLSVMKCDRFYSICRTTNSCYLDRIQPQCVSSVHDLALLQPSLFRSRDRTCSLALSLALQRFFVGLSHSSRINFPIQSFADPQEFPTLLIVSLVWPFFSDLFNLFWGFFTNVSGLSA